MPVHLKASARHLIGRIGNEGRIPRSSASQADGNQLIGGWRGDIGGCNLSQASGSL
jgi:hypothetical protein